MTLEEIRQHTSFALHLYAYKYFPRDFVLKNLPIPHCKKMSTAVKINKD